MNIKSYCIACGKRNFLRIGKAYVCASCGTELFLNTAAAAAGIIYDSRKRVLFTQRNKNPGMGKLDLPGGFIDYGENVEEGLRREISEELDLVVEEMNYFASFPNIYVWEGYEYHVVDLFFECIVKDFSTLHLSDEIETIEYRNPQQVMREEVCFESIWRVINAISKADCALHCGSAEQIMVRNIWFGDGPR